MDFIWSSSNAKEMEFELLQSRSNSARLESKFGKVGGEFHYLLMEVELELLELIQGPA